jgi:sigma-B regulation protein RsbU (phosphoserine phosphatase)
MVRLVLHSCSVSATVHRVPSCPFSAPSGQPPHILLDHLNHVLAENSLEDQFMTAFCGILDPQDGSFLYSNAGHPYPRWWRASRRVVEAVQSPAGPPLGNVRQESYQSQTILIEPGDLLVLYSDSLTALQNGEQRMSMRELLNDALCAAASHGAEAVKSRVLGRLDDFLAGKAHPDEITFLIIERQGQAGSSAAGWSP